ncbi:MAG: hypothetical protein J1F23_08405 [Oscillospiraceae bacterium]|nr:hypothetical protein [Oscillospiraceae bacterium]
MADKKTTEAAAQYTKAQLLTSKRYANRRDLISALLDDDKTYTADAVDALIEKYLKGKVK